MKALRIIATGTMLNSSTTPEEQKTVVKALRLGGACPPASALTMGPETAEPTASPKFWAIAQMPMSRALLAGSGRDRLISAMSDTCAEVWRRRARAVTWHGVRAVQGVA